MSIFSRFLDGIGVHRRSANIARERLQIVLSHERTAGNHVNDFLPRMRNELLTVIGKYITIDPGQINVQLQQTEHCSILELNIMLPTPTKTH